MTNNDDALLIDDDRLPKTEFADGGSDRIDCLLVYTGVLFVGPDRCDWAQFDFHDRTPPCALRFSYWSARCQRCLGTGSYWRTTLCSGRKAAGRANEKGHARTSAPRGL